MPATATIVCSTERLYAYDNANTFACGFNITISSDDPKATAPKLVRPWTWDGFHQVRLFVDDGANGAFLDQDVFPLTWHKTAVSKKRGEPGYKALIDQLEELTKNADFTLVPPSSGLPETVPLHADAPSKLKWPAFLADLSLRPAPIPHVLNLSFFLRIPKSPNARLVALAPIIPANVVNNQEISPKSPFALNLAGNVVDWPYEFPDYVILARTQIMDVMNGPTSSSAFFDLQRLMVKPGTQPAAGTTSGSNFYEDWRASLESNLSVGLDYSTLLEDSISDLNPKKGDLTKYLQAAIAAVRDTVGIGLYQRPDGGRFLDRLLKAPDWQQVEKAVAATFGDPQTWSNTLKTALPDELQGLQIWDPPVGLDATDAVIQLNRLHSALHEPDILRRVVRAQWQELGKTLPAFSGLEVPDDVDIRNELLLENLGWHWDRIRSALGNKTGSGSSPDTATSRTNLSVYAASVLNSRFSTNSGRYPTLDATALFLPLKNKIDGWASKLALTAIDSDTTVTKTNSDQQILTGYGLTLQIDALRDSGQDDKDDHLRRIRGVGLLLRRGTGGPWRCVSLASIQTRNGGTPILVEDTALIPSRVIYQNGLNLATISYNNDPLAAQGPLAFATDVQLHPGDPSSSEDRLLLYFYSVDQAAKLAGLVFGSSYDALPFLVSNSGILPPRIASAASPIEVSASLPNDLATTYKTYLRSNITYPRFAQVAPPRLFDQLTSQAISLPRIPANVFPRSREMQAGTQPETPLLLLAPKGQTFKGVNDSFAFSARPAATDIQTWDRFVNGTPRGTQTVREQVWCNYYALERKNRAREVDLGTPGKVTGPKFDNTIDDPATEFLTGAQIDRFFYVRLADETGAEICACFLKIPQPGTNGMGIVQAPSSNIRVEIGPGAKISGSEGSVTQVSPKTTLSGEIVLTVPDASVSSFELCSCVHKNHTARFSSFQGVPIAGTNYYRTSSQRVIVEVADSQFPSSADLWNAFALDPSATMTGTVSLKLEADAKEFKNVWRAEFMRQVWKWSGRPVTPVLPPPASGSSGADPDLAEWEVRQFGTRYDFDHIVMPMVRKQPFSFSYTEKMEGSGSSNDLKATYLRFGVRAYSRYAGILNSGYSAEARQDPDAPAWRSCFVPCRKFVNIKPLDVKLILPLTRKASDEQLPGLMVLLRGPWFQEGGLGELIEAEVQSAPDPDYADDAKPTTFYYQYGPDPILNSTLSVAPLVVGQDDVQLRRLTGPVGHTFDVGSDDPLFVNTSFLLSPPEIRRPNKQKVRETVPNDPWSFCRIRLKRVIHLDQEGPKKAESQFTQPFWVQYLPDFSIFGGIDVSDLFLKMTDATHLQLRDNAGPKQLDGQGYFSLLVVLTRRVIDATGSEGQEEFAGLFQKADPSNWALVGTQAVADYQTSEFRARVIEVQPGSAAGPLPKLSSADTLWDAMFRSDLKDSARARITRISSPVDSISITSAYEDLLCSPVATS
jgi:hypothetical protein